MPDVYNWIAWLIAVLAFALGAQLFGLLGVVVIAALALAGLTLLGVVAADRVRRENLRPDPRFRPTAEVFRDPRSGRLIRAYVDPATGERRYRPEV